MLLALYWILSIASLICFIMLVVKMFQLGETGWGVASIILIFCGIGGLIALIWGWMNAGRDPGVRKVTIAYTLIIVVNIILAIALVATGGFQVIQPQI